MGNHFTHSIKQQTRWRTRPPSRGSPSRSSTSSPGSSSSAPTSTPLSLPEQHPRPRTSLQQHGPSTSGLSSTPFWPACSSFSFSTPALSPSSRASAGASSSLAFSMESGPPSSTTATTFSASSLPSSLWHAYAVFLVVLTGFTAFSKDTSHHATLATKVVACIALVFLASTAVGYAFHSSRGDIAGAAVIAWMLLAIFSKQHHPRIIHWFALASFIVSLLAIVKAVVFTARNPSLTSDDGERAPLIAGSRE